MSKYVIDFKLPRRLGLSACLVFLITWFNHDALPAIHSILGTGMPVLVFLITLSIFFICLLSGRCVINKTLLIGAATMVTLLLVTIALNQDFRGAYLALLLSWGTAFALVHIVPFKSFVEHYTSIIYFVAISSLIAQYVLFPVVDVLPGFLFSRFINLAGVPFINMRIAYLIDFPHFLRNLGIFREPGVYQIFLNFALMLELYFNSTVRINFRRVLVFMITIFSTFSIPGYIAALLLIMGYLFSGRLNYSMQGRKLLALLMLISVAGLVLYLVAPAFRTEVVSALDKLLTRGVTFQGRMTSITATLQAWQLRPIFGSGISSGLLTETYDRIARDVIGPVSITTTHGAYLAAFGLLFVLLNLFMIYRLACKLSSMRLIRGLLFATIVLLLNTQFMIYNEIVYSLVFYGIKGGGTVIAVNKDRKDRSALNEDTLVR